MQLGEDPGAAEQLTAWMDAWGDRVMRFAYVYTGDPWSAQDVAQETFVRLYQHLMTKPERAPRPSWLFTVARNVAVDALRRRRRRANTASAVAREDVPPDDPAERIAVRHVLNSLPDPDRTCLVLFYFADWKVEEISRELQLSPATVKTRLHRARARFAKAWKETEDE